MGFIERGKVCLVGAGPGDPDLLTVKAVRTLAACDVVLHDALVSAEVLAVVSPRAKVINVGKRCGQKRISQDQINDLLVQYATAGAVVVRLKSGDPSIFGRAGEEIEVLQNAGIEVEIVPGVTASLAAAAKLGISLTDRRTADQLLFISAHHSHDKQNFNWSGLLNRRTTVVVYMPGDYKGVASDLQDAGLSDSMPCAIVSKLSSPDEQWHRTTLGSLHCAPVMPSPCVLIVGETVGPTSTASIRPQIFQSIPFQEDFRESSVQPTDF